MGVGDLVKHVPSDCENTKYLPFIESLFDVGLVVEVSGDFRRVIPSGELQDEMWFDKEELVIVSKMVERRGGACGSKL